MIGLNNTPSFQCWVENEINTSTGHQGYVVNKREKKTLITHFKSTHYKTI